MIYAPYIPGHAIYPNLLINTGRYIQHTIISRLLSPGCVYQWFAAFSCFFVCVLTFYSSSLQVRAHTGQTPLTLLSLDGKNTEENVNETSQNLFPGVRQDCLLRLDAIFSHVALDYLFIHRRHGRYQIPATRG